MLITTDLYALPPNITEPFVFKDNIVGITTLALTNFLNDCSNNCKQHTHNSIMETVKRTHDGLLKIDTTNWSSGHSEATISYYDISESSCYLEESVDDVDFLYITPDLALMTAMECDLLVRHRMLSELQIVTSLTNRVANSDIEDPTLINVMPYTKQYSSKEKTIVTLGEMLTFMRNFNMNIIDG